MRPANELLNYFDAEGLPVCPTCGRTILPRQGVMRVADCMIHVSCFAQTRLDAAPCEPVP